MSHGVQNTSCRSSEGVKHNGVESGREKMLIPVLLMLARAAKYAQNVHCRVL